MARIILHEAKGPKEVDVGDDSVWICMCGLSGSYPVCDGTHKKTKDEEEGKIYEYDDDRERKEVRHVG